MNCIPFSKRLLLLYLLLVACFSGFAQQLTFAGFTMLGEKPLANAKVRAMYGGKVYAETTSDLEGAFSLKLDFLLHYEVYFEKEGFALMHTDITGGVPEEVKHYKIKYEITVPFYRLSNDELNLNAFEKPFTKIFFDGKTKFVDDPDYLKAFLLTLQKPDAPVETVKVPPVIERKYRIAGKVLNNDTSRSPYRLVKVFLVDTNQKIIGSTLTNKYGVFTFPNAGPQSTFEIKLEADAAGKADIYDLKKQKLASPGKVEGAGANTSHYLNSRETKLVERLRNDNYVPFIAGKLSIEQDGENALLTGKNVYLLSDRNEVLETVKTNIIGNFLFSKLSPDKNFTIGVDETDPGVAVKRKIHLYSSKDVEIMIKDTLLNGRQLFRFLSGDVKTYNELLVEDTDIRMDLNGKMVGDNENNPLRNIRIVLLDNTYKIIDSVKTDGKGNFNFRYLPYNNDLVLQIRDTNDLANYASIILYDQNGKLVKYISINSNKQFRYRLLPAEASRLDELYVDDPWLHLADRNLKLPTTKNMVIVENIYFDFNKAELLPAAKQTLDKAILAMKSNPSMKMDISAHSDSKGSDDYNLKLSEQRAQNALDFIVSKGIDKSRITAKGYGETKLLNRCGNKVECPEEQHAKNRRLEFNIRMN